MMHVHFHQERHRERERDLNRRLELNRLRAETPVVRTVRKPFLLMWFPSRRLTQAPPRSRLSAHGGAPCSS